MPFPSFILWANSVFWFRLKISRYYSHRAHAHKELGILCIICNYISLFSIQSIYLQHYFQIKVLLSWKGIPIAWVLRSVCKILEFIFSWADKRNMQVCLCPPFLLIRMTKWQLKMGSKFFATLFTIRSFTAGLPYDRCIGTRSWSAAVRDIP